MGAEYFRIHNWISYHHGKATKCENEKCKSGSPKRFEWALLKGNDYKRDRNNFIMLCPSCHRKYDFTEQTRQKMSTGRKGVPAKNKVPVVGNGIEYESLTVASLKTGVSITSIANNLSGLSKTAGGIKWVYKQTN